MTAQFSIKLKNTTLSWNREDLSAKLKKLSELDDQGKLGGKTVVIKKDLSVKTLGNVKQFFWSMLSNTRLGRRIYGVDYNQNEAIFTQIKDKLTPTDNDLIELFNASVNKYNHYQDRVVITKVEEENPIPKATSPKAISPTLARALEQVENVPKAEVVHMSSTLLDPLGAKNAEAAHLDISLELEPPKHAVKLKDGSIATVFGKTKVVLVKGSTLDQNTDAIVNAANERLLGGGGIDGQIWSRSGALSGAKDSGEFLKAEIMPIKANLPSGNLPNGEAVITRALGLNSRYIIHAVGPRGAQPKVLRNAYLNSLELLDANQLKSISFCCISQSIFGYSPKDAAPIVVDLIRRYCEYKDGPTTDLQSDQLQKMVEEDESFDASKLEPFEREIRLVMYSDNEWDEYSKLDVFKTA
ncbi:UPF0189 protein TTE0995 [Parachlamydia acanthamoebae UV-7]|uniref:UPF0189 protein TTE0995 n=2 Tax=Parachlamydia acanthamoebae TaxID=83552 RepID=F8KXR8_PARAV|nr:macro domain-containing protein [Parachlamydia acanthamoebae]CCB85648.1 UPF0189 protein TTE0995 [Parachlamydia acanthamoebae UV-7]